MTARSKATKAALLERLGELELELRAIKIERVDNNVASMRAARRLCRVTHGIVAASRALRELKERERAE